MPEPDLPACLSPGRPLYVWTFQAQVRPWPVWRGVHALRSSTSILQPRRTTRWPTPCDAPHSPSLSGAHVVMRWSLQNEPVESAIGGSVPTSGTAVGIQRRPRPLQYARKLSKLKGSEWLLLLQMSTLLCSFLMMHRKLSRWVLMERVRRRTGSAGNVARATPPPRLSATGLVRFTLRDRYCMKRSVLIFHFLRRWGTLLASSLVSSRRTAHCEDTPG